MTDADEAAPAADESARAVFLAWERLRLWYNAALAAVVVLLVPLGGPADERELLFLAECAFGANLCFCLGPVVEGYLSLLGVSRRTARGVVFVPGLLLALLLTLTVLFLRIALPNQD